MNNTVCRNFNYNEKWFKSSREDRLKVYIKDYLKNLEGKIDELF